MPDAALDAVEDAALQPDGFSEVKTCSDTSLDFDPTPHIAHDNCVDYTESAVANVAVAICDGAISAGPIGGPLAPMGIEGESPRLSPNSGTLIVKRNVFAGFPDLKKVTFHRLVREDGAWHDMGAMELGVELMSERLIPTNAWVSTMTRDEQRLILVDRVNDPLRAPTIYELEPSANGWTPVASYPEPPAEPPYARDMALPYQSLHLSPDGLHLLYSGLDRIMRQRSRADRSLPFGEPTVVPVPDDVTTPFVVDDCTRLYFSRGGSTFYLTRS